MLGWFEENEDDKRLLEDVVKYYQPSMKIVSNGAGSWCLVMDPAEGRRTARTKGKDGEYVIDSIIKAKKHQMSDAELTELKNSWRK